MEYACDGNVVKITGIQGGHNTSQHTFVYTINYNMLYIAYIYMYLFVCTCGMCAILGNWIFQPRTKQNCFTHCASASFSFAVCLPSQLHIVRKTFLILGTTFDLIVRQSPSSSSLARARAANTQQHKARDARLAIIT